MISDQKFAVGADSTEDPRAARERIPVHVYPHSTQANKAVAKQIADLIRERAAEGRNCVLGLATGSTPVGVYDELVRLHREAARRACHPIDRRCGHRG